MIDYTKGDVLTLKSGDVWLVRDARPSQDDPDRTVVGLVDPDHLNHGTAFYADALYRENLVVLHRRGPLPEERYTTSVRDDGSYVYDVIKQAYVVGRFDLANAERRIGELNAEWQREVVSQF